MIKSLLEIQLYLYFVEIFIQYYKKTLKDVILNMKKIILFATLS